MHPEVGKAITNPRGLADGTIVVIVPPGLATMVTMCVVHVEDDVIMFRGQMANGSEWFVVNRLRDDGAVVDDRGWVVEIYEYLGD